MNGTTSADDADSTEDETLYRQLLLPSYILSLCVSLAALLSLVFTLWIFARKRDATAGARGMVLLIVTGLFTSAALTVLHVSSIFGLTEAAGPAGNSTEAEFSPSMEMFADAQYLVTNASLLLRNWWVTFLTGIRFIVILFPLHVPEILTRRRQSVAFGLILCLSVAISVLRHVEEKSCSAGGDGTGPNSNMTAQQEQQLLLGCERFILFFFVMQTGIPVPAVLVLSVALAVHLCAAREPSDASAASGGFVRRSDSTVSSNVISSTSAAAVSATWRQQHHLAASSAVKNRGRCRKRKATRILLVLAATFTVLELPTFVYFIMLHFFPSFRSSSRVKGQLIFSGFNALITLDTLANFFIFFVFSDSFKREVQNCLRRGLPVPEACQCREKRLRLRNLRDGGGGGGGGEGGGGGGCGDALVSSVSNGAAELDLAVVAGGAAVRIPLAKPTAMPELYPPSD